MSDKQFIELMAVVKPPPAPVPPKSDSALLLKVGGTVLAAVIGFYLIGTLTAAQESKTLPIKFEALVKDFEAMQASFDTMKATSVSSVQITSLQQDITELSASVKTLESSLSNARQDPFTGSDGTNLRRSLETEIETVEDNSRLARRELDERLRLIENKLLQP